MPFQISIVYLSIEPRTPIHPLLRTQIADFQNDGNMEVVWFEYDVRPMYGALVSLYLVCYHSLRLKIFPQKNLSFIQNLRAWLVSR